MSEDTLFHRLTIAVVLAIFAISGYHRHKADKVAGAVSRDAEPVPLRLALSLCGLMGFGGLLLYMVWPPALAWTMVTLPTAVRWTGLAAATASILAAWWVFRALGLNVTRTVKTRATATLVTTGPYRFVRHPLYLTGAIAFAAVSLMTQSWWFVAWIVPTLVLLMIRTKQEEQNLEARFGDAWCEYAAHTGRFIPRLTR